jgi:hypothetical protein
MRDAAFRVRTERARARSSFLARGIMSGVDDRDLKTLIEQTAAETRRHFDVVADGLVQKIELVAEGVASVDRRFDRLERRIETEFEELRSMIRLSYTEIDRRLRTLEETVAVLQARMDRFESHSSQ